MLKKFIILISLIAIISCDQDDEITINKEPGTFTGTVLPLGIQAKITLKQGAKEFSADVNENGLFVITDLMPGVYVFKVSANNYGSHIRENIKIEDGEGYDIGLIELTDMPNPLFMASPCNEEVNTFQYNPSLYFYFNKRMDLNTFENALVISPTTEILSIDENSDTFSNVYRYYVKLNLKAGENYNVKLDSALKSYSGESLEFPYTFSFSTIPFMISAIDTTLINSAKDPIRVSFNNYFSANLSKHIVIEPDIELDATNRYNDLVVLLNSWLPDTKFRLTILKSLTDYEGNQLMTDTSIAFTTPPITIVETSPLDKQQFVPRSKMFEIKFNYMLDENSLFFGECITIEPAIDLTIAVSSFNNRSIIYLQHQGLEPKTKYTLTINQKLKDYFGNNLEEDFAFSFTTM